MAKLSFRKHCPICKGFQLQRLRQRRWMFLIPFINYYRCNYCWARVLIPFYSSPENVDKRSGEDRRQFGDSSYGGPEKRNGNERRTSQLLS